MLEREGECGEGIHREDDISQLYMLEVERLFYYTFSIRPYPTSLDIPDIGRCTELSGSK